MFRPRNRYTVFVLYTSTRGAISSFAIEHRPATLTEFASSTRRWCMLIKPHLQETAHFVREHKVYPAARGFVVAHLNDSQSNFPTWTRKSHLTGPLQTCPWWSTRPSWTSWNRRVLYSVLVSPTGATDQSAASTCCSSGGHQLLSSTWSSSVNFDFIFSAEYSQDKTHN